jgi:hypothetical protein
MIGALLRIVVFLALGVALGVVHSRAVAEGERIHRETGERVRPAVLFVIRLVVVCVAFGAIGKSGPMPLAAAIVGFFGVRVMKGRT